MWHPGLKDVRDRTRVGYGRYLCQGCQGVFSANEMRCDHVLPVVELSGFRDWNTYIARMFDAIPDGIQHLCKACHDVKTREERVARVGARRQRKLDEAS
jgi:hypothetical protein